MIEDDDISMAFGTTKAESGGVGTVDLDPITTASLHGLGGETEKTEYGFNFDQRIPISLAQSESATSSDLAIPNDGSRSISDLSYSNGDATNLLKKRKKRKNHRYRPISNNPSLFMKGTATSTNVKVDGIDPDMLSCDDIDEIENDKRPPSKRRQRSSFTAHSDASRNHTGSNVISERLHDSIIGRAGSQGERGNVPSYNLTYVDKMQVVRSRLRMGLTISSRLTAISPIWMSLSPRSRKSQQATKPHQYHWNMKPCLVIPTAQLCCLTCLSEAKSALPMIQTSMITFHSMWMRLYQTAT